MKYKKMTGFNIYAEIKQFQNFEQYGKN